jgi:hypothetical protein
MNEMNKKDHATTIELSEGDVELINESLTEMLRSYEVNPFEDLTDEQRFEIWKRGLQRVVTQGIYDLRCFQSERDHGTEWIVFGDEGRPS